MFNRFYHILRSIVENYPEGHPLGTLHNVTISFNGNDVFNQDYHILETELVCIVEDEIAKYVKINKEQDEKITYESKAKKDAIKASQLNEAINTELSDNQLTLLNNIINQNQDVVSQYKNGKEKAINVLVGKVLKSDKAMKPQIILEHIKGLLSEI